MNNLLGQMPDVRAIRAPHTNASKWQKMERTLLAMRARLTGAVQSSMGMLSSETSTGPEDIMDGAHVQDVFSTETKILESSSGTIEQIDIALKRIQQGIHDKCENCGCTIPVARHNAIPYAITCVKCAKGEEGPDEVVGRGWPESRSWVHYEA